MLRTVAFGLAIVLATVSGSLAGSHTKKSNGHYSPTGAQAESVPNPSAPTIFGWPVETQDRAKRK
jgi:hypothetical protein